MIQSSIPETLELFMSCRKLKKRDLVKPINPQVHVLRETAEGDWVAVGKTEALKNTSNPNFYWPVTIDFHFEHDQKIRLDIVDTEPSPGVPFVNAGSVEITIGELLGARKQLSILTLKSQEDSNVGKMVVQCEKTQKSMSEVCWQWQGVDIRADGWRWFWKFSPFLRFLKIREGNDLLQVHETEVIATSSDPLWHTCKILDRKLCGGDHKRKFKIECWDDLSRSFIGGCETSLDELKNGKTTFQLRHPQKKKPAGSLTLKSFNLEPQYSFIEYIRGGQQIKVVVGIDFTGSNKNPSDPNSLHAINPQRGFNKYQKAIYAICHNLINYDYDKMIPVYGFGGIPRFPGYSTGGVSHCFPITGNPMHPAVFGIEGIMNTYQYALQHVELSGPTNFAPLINEVMNFCQAQKDHPNGFYTVLLILTDGEIHDMEKTVDCIIKSAHLPLSIIIVGIGNEDFFKMQRIDGKHEIKNQAKEKAMRNLVQFVPFKKLNEDMQLLADHVLADVPNQLVKYKQFIGEEPNPPISVDMSKMGYSQPLHPQDGRYSHQQSYQNQGFYDQGPQQDYSYQQQQPQYQQYQDPSFYHPPPSLYQSQAFYDPDMSMASMKEFLFQSQVKSPVRKEEDKENAENVNFEAPINDIAESFPDNNVLHRESVQPEPEKIEENPEMSVSQIPQGGDKQEIPEEAEK